MIAQHSLSMQPRVAPKRVVSCNVARSDNPHNQSISTKNAFVSLLCAAMITVTPSIASAISCDEGETTAANGLTWCDVKEGTGAVPKKGDLISANYVGRLKSNGKKFDSSYDRGTPLNFNVGVGRVIKGWDVGILGNDEIPAMKEGGQRRLFIPSELGYGSRGAGRVIPADADLDFLVSLEVVP